jgi:hypothetical protein
MGIEEIRKLKDAAKSPKEPKKYSLPKKSKKKLEQEAKDRAERGGEDTNLQKWYKSCQKQMSGNCMECGKIIETRDYKSAILSICHILPKRKNIAPSVATHPLNWIELCPDHHTKFDNIGWDERSTWGCWNEVKDRLVMLYEDIARDERRHFPDIVLKYIIEKDPFKNYGRHNSED